MKYINYYQSPIGKLGIVEENNAIIELTLENRILNKDAIISKTQLICETIKQLEEYFNHQRTVFDLPLNPKGTPFQQSVYHMLRTIPYGTTISYKQLATLINNPNASRAVGNANNKNPIIIVIPCHRVIGSNQKLVGYALGLDIKKQLLEFEKEL